MTSVLFHLVLLAFVCVSAEQSLKSLRGLPSELNSAPAHPGSASYLGMNMTESMVHNVNGKMVATATGEFACDYGGVSAPIYLRASWRGTVKLAAPRPSGTSSLETVWIGWNNLVTNRVDRYLIVKELDSTGMKIKEHCTTYPDVNPKGYKDPLPLMADRYRLVKSSEDFSEYEYRWTLQSGAQMLSTMVSDTQGFPPKSVDIVSTTSGGDKSEYSFTYATPLQGVNPSIFYEYQKYDCATVPNFTTPDVCVDPWLALQYECAFTDVPAGELTV